MKHLKQALRRQMRQQRHALSSAKQQQASRYLLKHVINIDAFIKAKHIAAYVPHQGEMDPQPLLSYEHHHGKHCYLPVLSVDKSRHMHFIAVDPDKPLQTNRYGIPEPSYDPTRERQPEDFDLVIVPLVAFDKHCHRLGMGGGYYDKTFSFMENKSLDKPFMLGIAYEFQYCETLPKAQHDIPLHAVVTEQQIYYP